MAAHLLTPYVNEETVELLVASLYYGAQPFAAPGAAHVGFLRFLRLLSTHDFDSEPIVVDPHGEISHGALAEMRRTFREERAALPPIFIGTPQVRGSWGSGKGCMVVADAACYLR